MPVEAESKDIEVLIRLSKYKSIKANADRNFGECVVCPVCEKTYYILNRADWAYKRMAYSNKIYLCTYACAREVDKLAKKYTTFGGRWKKIVTPKN